MPLFPRQSVGTHRRLYRALMTAAVATMGGAVAHAANPSQLANAEPPLARRRGGKPECRNPNE